MTVRKVSARQMREYLASLGVETEVDLEAQRLYVVHVDISTPEAVQRAKEILDNGREVH